jgi:hypothetical protein
MTTVDAQLVGFLTLASIALAATLLIAADVWGRSIARRIDAAYDAGYAEGKAVAGRQFNASQVRWSA